MHRTIGDAGQPADMLGMHPEDVMNGQDLYTGELLRPVEVVEWVG